MTAAGPATSIGRQVTANSGRRRRTTTTAGVPTTIAGTSATTHHSTTGGGTGTGTGSTGGGTGTTGGTGVTIAPPPAGQATRLITAGDQASLAKGFTVPAGQIWEFDPAQNVAIEVSGNVRVEGVLRMRPRSADVQHFLKFVNVNEGGSVGGGMAVLDSDVGVWVTGAGQLDLQGAARTGWSRVSGSADVGATQLTLASAPNGWRVGDEITIAPTAAPSVRGYSTQFEERTITAINGAVVTLNAPLKFSHPAVNNQWTAEVMNLSRNVRIEGVGTNKPAPEGRAHIWISSSRPQTVKWVQLRHLGARTTDTGRDPTAGVVGRYSLHFHHSMDGSRGTIIEGVVVRNSGNSAYVPHASYGITMRDNVAYDGWEDAVWWDPAPEARAEEHLNDSHDIVMEHNIVALLRDDPDFRGYRLAGFTLATGSNLVIRDSVAVGVQGNEDASGFEWPEETNPLNIWDFSKGNIAHNNRTNGIFVWQNNSNPHKVANFVAYHNGESGIEHGAYLNGYQYSGITLFGNGKAALTQHSGSVRSGGGSRSDGYGLVFENISGNGVLRLEMQNLRSSRPALYRNCSFDSVSVENDGSDNNPGLYDFVDCGLQAEDFSFPSAEAGTRIRVQNGSTAFELDASGSKTAIAPFYTS